MIEYPVSSGVFSTNLPFSPAVKVGNLIFVSGQASTSPTGEIIPDTFENEFRRSMDNLKRIVEAAGSSLSKIVQVRAYVRDESDWQRYNELYREYFKPPLPA